MYSNRQLSNLLILLSILTILVILQITQLLTPILECIQLFSFFPTSIIIAFIFEPFIEYIPLKSRFIKSSCVYLGLLLILAIVVLLIVPSFKHEAEILVAKVHTFSSSDFTLLRQVEGLDFNKGIEIALSSTMNIFKSLGNFSLGYVAAYFISLDFPTIVHFIFRHFPLLSRFDNFYKTCHNLIFHYIKGLSLDIALLFGINLFVLYFFRFEHPFVFALLLAFMNLIPYVGATIAQLLVLTVDTINYGSFRLELFISLFVVQQIESNLLQPYIFKKMLNIKPILTLCSILFFGLLFGLFGVILAPILAGILQLLYQSYIYTNKRKKVGTWENVWYNFEEIKDEDK